MNIDQAIAYADQAAAKAQPHIDQAKATAKVQFNEAKEYFKAAAAESDKKTFKAMGLGAAFAIAAVGLLNIPFAIANRNAEYQEAVQGEALLENLRIEQRKAEKELEELSTLSLDEILRRY